MKDLVCKLINIKSGLGKIHYYKKINLPLQLRKQICYSPINW